MADPKPKLDYGPAEPRREPLMTLANGVIFIALVMTGLFVVFVWRFRSY